MGAVSRRASYTRSESSVDSASPAASAPNARSAALLNPNDDSPSSGCAGTAAGPAGPVPSRSLCRGLPRPRPRLNVGSAGAEGSGCRIASWRATSRELLCEGGQVAEVRRVLVVATGCPLLRDWSNLLEAARKRPTRPTAEAATCEESRTKGQRDARESEPN